WGVGPVRNATLAEYGIQTVGDLAQASKEHLTAWLGPGAANHFHALAWNRDGRSVRKPGRAGSMGSQSALGRGLTRETDLSVALLRIADRLSARLRKKGRAGRTITVRARFADMRAVTRAITLPAAVSTTAALHSAAVELLADARREQPGPVTLVAISMSKLELAGPLQLELPFSVGDALHPGSPVGAAQLSVDEQIDKARERFGKDAVGRASVVLGGSRGVPDEFRELAEKD
ncbi:MAG: DNA polymerase IV, partial [Acidimicrobiia bacterium]|nr:DNA polymerase IV [Acidimicrobiia bacterium]